MNNNNNNDLIQYASLCCVVYESINKAKIFNYNAKNDHIIYHIKNMFLKAMVIHL